MLTTAATVFFMVSTNLFQIQATKLKVRRINSDWTASGGWISVQYRGDQEMVPEWVVVNDYMVPGILPWRISVKDEESITDHSNENELENGLLGGDTHVEWEDLPASSVLTLYIHTEHHELSMDIGPFQSLSSAEDSAPTDGMHVDGSVLDYFPHTTVFRENDAIEMNFRIKFEQDSRVTITCSAWCNFATATMNFWWYEGTEFMEGDLSQNILMSVTKLAMDDANVYQARITILDANSQLQGHYACKMTPSISSGDITFSTGSYVLLEGQDTFITEPFAMCHMGVDQDNQYFIDHETRIAAGQKNIFMCALFGIMPIEVTLHHDGNPVELSHPIHSKHDPLHDMVWNTHVMPTVREADAGEYIWRFETGDVTVERAIQVIVV